MELGPLFTLVLFYMTGEHIEKTIRRVAVIGGGPGGIAAIRALKKEESFSTITVYERNEQIGGAW